MSRDHYDALIDQLLKEILGGDRPRDISARVLHQAKIHDRFRRRWWIGAGSALAACAAIAAGLAMYWPHTYPSPEADQVFVLNGPNIQRGAQIVTYENEGSLRLGDYVDMSVGSDTALTIGGSNYEEKVLLDRGSLRVKVAKNRGRFDIAVGPAIVHVTGTQFGVDVQESVEESRRLKTLVVDVTEGSVDVQSAGATQTLKAGNTGRYVISSAPIPVNKAIPVQTTTSPTQTTPLRGRPGLQLGMQEGARIGTRGGTVRPPQEPIASARGALNNASIPAPQSRQLLMVIAEGVVEQTGRLGLDHGMYVLATERGSYLLFPQDAPLKDWKPVTSQAIRVTWTRGKVTTITPMDAPK